MPRTGPDLAQPAGSGEDLLATQRIGDTLGRLVHALDRRTAAAGTHHPAALPGLLLYRADHPVGPTCGVYEPCLGLVVQGAKRVVLGDEAFVYDPRHFLITSLGLPTVSQVLEASPARPFLSLVLQLDLQEINRLVLEGQLPPAAAADGDRAMAIGRVGWPLLRAVERLVELLDEPDSIPVVAPLVQREILYWLLVSDQGTRLRQIGSAGSHSQQVAQAIDWLRRHFARPLRIEDLADEARMSPSTFHRHFKALTAMSPLQYQKRLRLNEARRLMFTDGLDASTAAFRVGYESVSQFSREYSRAFGAPPMRDIAQLRHAALAPA